MARKKIESTKRTGGNLYAEKAVQSSPERKQKRPTPKPVKRG